MYAAMPVRGITVLAILVKLVRNICLWFRDIQGMEIQSALVQSSVGHELFYLNLRNYCYFYDSKKRSCKAHTPADINK